MRILVIRFLAAKVIKIICGAMEIIKTKPPVGTSGFVLGWAD